MYSLFEKIMNQSLFNGLSKESILEFTEKVPLLFSKYKTGECLISEESDCDSIACLLDGTVNFKMFLFDRKLTLEYRQNEGISLASNHLFGIDTSSSCEITAVTDCAVMSFSKKQYVQMLQHNQLMLINYLNYLSLQGQKVEINLKSYSLNHPTFLIRFIIETLTDRKSYNIILRTNQGDTIYNTLGFTSCNEYENFMKVFRSQGTAEGSETLIKINDRARFLRALT